MHPPDKLDASWKGRRTINGFPEAEDGVVHVRSVAARTAGQRCRADTFGPIPVAVRGWEPAHHTERDGLGIKNGTNGIGVLNQPD
jgi:hypothetical protein